MHLLKDGYHQQMQAITGLKLDLLHVIQLQEDASFAWNEILIVTNQTNFQLEGKGREDAPFFSGKKQIPGKINYCFVWTPKQWKNKGNQVEQ